MSASTNPAGGALSALDDAPVWLNSEPLTAAGLRGRVVAVDFWTYSCINWLRTLPYVRAWHERYRDRGLVVVGVHAPEFGFEHDLDNVRHAVGELDVGYPVVIDNGFTIWRAFENHYWPAIYLVDGDGHLRFHHFGEEAYEEIERSIQQLLGVEEELVRVDAGGVAAGGRLGRAEVPGDLPGPRARRAPQRPPSRRAHAQPVGARRSSGRSARRPPSSTRPAARSPTASRAATSTWSSCRRPPPRSASSCASTAGRPAMPTASTSTSPAKARCPSRGCTSSSASQDPSASGPSRSRSTARACARTSSPSVEPGSERHCTVSRSDEDMSCIPA